MVVMGIVSCVMLNEEETRLAGIFILSGTVVHAWSLLRMVAKKWREIGVMIAIYREIIEIIERETSSLPSSAR
ncbi:hypothetical protein [Geobacter anodireducens]